MQKMTSAYANKKLKSLEEDKAFWVNKEATSCTYIAAINEEPVIPEYDYLEVAQIIEDIDAKIAVEYSCAVTPQIRQMGNHLSGNAGTAYASLLA